MEDIEEPFLEEDGLSEFEEGVEKQDSKLRQ